MQALEFNHEDFNSHNQNEADKGLLVKFYLKSVMDKDESSFQGRPMFKDLEYVDIKIPGQRDGVARPATARDKSRFPQHYQAFKNRMEMPVSGTPLTEWPAISRSLADQFAFLNIKTVEQLANLNDSLMHEVKGCGNLKQKAKDWLEATKSDGVLSQLRDELTSRDLKIEEQTKQLEAQEKRLNGLLARLEKVEKA